MFIKGLKGVLYSLVAICLVLIFAISCAKKNAVDRDFNIGFNQWIGFAPFYLANEKGYYKDMNVSFNFIDLEGDKRAGLYSGRLDMICETMDMFQTNREDSQYPGVIVFAIDESYGGDGIIAANNVNSIDDLIGKKIASEPGLPAHFVLQYLLFKKGLSLDDINVQDMTSADAAAAFIAKQVDVAGTYEPYISTALNKREGSHILVSTKDLPGMILDVAIITEKTLNERRADINVIYEGWCKAVSDLNSNPTESIEIMAKAFNLTADEFVETKSGIRYFGLSENNDLFGTIETQGPIFDNFDMISDILIMNELTKAEVTASDKINVSVVLKPNR